jgi:hypothetical protein
MALLTSNEVNRSATTDSNGIRHYTRVFQVFSDDPMDGPAVIAGYVGINLLDTYDALGDTADDNAQVKTISPRMVTGNLGEWEVTYEYSTERQQGQIKYSARQTTEILTEDWNGDKVLNSADCPFDPPLEVPLAISVIQLTVFRDTFDATKQIFYLNTVNDAMWNGYAAGRLRCTNYAGTRIYTDAPNLWQVDIELEYHPYYTWNDTCKLLDQGVIEKLGVPFDPPYRPILADGQAINAPVPLKNGRAKLAADAPVYLAFVGYFEQDWSALL